MKEQSTKKAREIPGAVRPGRPELSVKEDTMKELFYLLRIFALLLALAGEMGMPW